MFNISYTPRCVTQIFSALDSVLLVLKLNRSWVRQVGFSLQNLSHHNPNVAYIRHTSSPGLFFHLLTGDSQSSGSGQAKGNEPHKWEHLTTRTVRERNATVKKKLKWCGRRSEPLHFSTSPVNLRGLCRRTAECLIHSVYYSWNVSPCFKRLWHSSCTVRGRNVRLQREEPAAEEWRKRMHHNVHQSYPSNVTKW